jgi:hypothetical protein
MARITHVSSPSNVGLLSQIVEEHFTGNVRLRLRREVFPFPQLDVLVRPLPRHFGCRDETFVDQERWWRPEPVENTFLAYDICMKLKQKFVK